MAKVSIRSVKVLIGTFFFTGLSPIAPATVASFFSLLFPFFLHPFPLLYSLFTIFIFFLGVHIATDLEKIWGKDARRITIDEVLGILVTFLFITRIGKKTLLLGFLLFRLFDIGKLPFIKKSQELKSGWGVMVDDLLAGILANITLRLLTFFGIND
ncbi:MAG: phosphatidylglycerophosphatase A [candidate division WOR-3 bacterium]